MPSPSPSATATATARPTPLPPRTATARPAPAAVAATRPPTAAPTQTATARAILPPILMVPTLVPASPTPLPTSTPAATVIAPITAPPPTASVSPVLPSLSGDWAFRAAATAGNVIAGTLRFQSAPSGLLGTYIGLRGNATQLSNLRVSGNSLSFDLVTPRAVWHMQGILSGDKIEGTFQTAERTVPWTALRQGAGISPTPASR